MCGVTGWVSYDRDLASATATVDAMTAPLCRRGPDEGGVWIDGHAALGHRRLCVIDVEGGKQPMVDPAAPQVAITYSGETYNHVELRDQLAARGHVFRTRSDTEVVLHAYLEWGAALVDHLNGIYAFAVWDGRTQELLLVRDRLGVKPLFYHPTPHGVLFGSEPKAILASRQVEVAVDADGFREMFTSVKTPGAAYFRGMHEVRPGHVVRVRPEGLTEHRYWALEAEEHTDDLETTVETVRALLDDIVTKQVVSDVPLCTLLSGGLDSSAITALTQRALRAQGADPIRSFAVEFTGQPESFQADHLRSTPDAPYVHALAEHVGASHHDIRVDTRDLMDPEHRTRTVVARDAPPWGDMDISMYLLFAAVAQHSTVALSGEAADEVFGGYSWFHDPVAVTSPTFPWLVGLANEDRSAILRPEVAAKLDLDGYVADRYADALAAVPRLPGEHGLERRMREISHMHLTRFLQILLDRKDRLSMASGLEVRVPFCDHRLVQYVFNVPWAMKTFDGREKSLLRAAVGDLLPDSVRDRVKSPYPSTQDLDYHRSLQRSVEELLARDHAPVLDVLEPAMVAGMAAAPAGADPHLREGLEIVLGGDEWARHHGVTIAL